MLKSKLAGFKKPAFSPVLCLIFLILASIFSKNLFSQTTGKLSGQVEDADGNPLIGVNVVVEGTSLGGATDEDGYYVILNIRAGTYSVRYLYIGYQTKIVQDVRVKADQTTTINVELAPEAISGEAVTVTAQRPIIEYNETSSISTMGKDEIDVLPIRDLNGIVNLQAGVVNGHFRGGRLGEVQYQVDGVTVNNLYDNSSTLQLDRSVLQEVQVISGTFDAKYGQAMSGVVNAVLRSGSQEFNWSGEVYGGDYYTTDTLRYPHDNGFDPRGIQYYQLTFSGPTFIPKTTFFVNGTYLNNKGWLFGERLFLPTDSNNVQIPIFHPTGDRKIVPMQTHREWAGQFKVSNQSIENIQVSYQALLNDIRDTRYNNSFRFNPGGLAPKKTISITHGIDITHTLSPKTFYKISFRQNYYKYTDYKYENLFDPRYQAAGAPQSHPDFGYGAVVQGVETNRFIQKTNAGIAKGDFTWQYNRSNLIETGFEFQTAEMLFGSPGFFRIVGDSLIPRYPQFPDDPRVSVYYPKILSAYAQDRLEWKDLVLRGGLRLESFDANTTVPSDLQNPANSIAGAPESVPVNTTIKTAVAPRLGFSFPLSASASMYFSYGHFYQMPGLGNLYNNSNYKVLQDLQEGGISYGVMGNPDLKPEKTIQYEFGLKQAITPKMGVDLTFFYKDIRDLLGVQFISTYAAADYARFTNVDFGSVTGFTISIDQRPIGNISTTLDYTMQFAQGNSSNPRETSNRAEAGKDPRPRVIPFNWDQRHTLNATAIYFKPNNFTISFIFKFGSGQPYTPQIGSGFGADLETNSGRKSGYLLLDFHAEKYISYGPATWSVYMRVFNILNTHFVNGFVFQTTGSPDYAQFPLTQQASLVDPSRFYTPRRVEIGLSFTKR